MIKVWTLRHNVTDFNYLAARGKDLGTPPPVDRLPLGTPQLKTWGERYIWYDPTEFRKNKGTANFPTCSGTTVCDAEAKEIIRELIEDHVEFLPLAYYENFVDKAIDSKYFAINVLQILDCLDYERSEFSYYGPLKKIIRYEFKSDCIRGIPIFKLPILNRVTTYVTDEFKQLVEDNNLTGLEFRKVWEG